jgi:hypothetical protein
MIRFTRPFKAFKIFYSTRKLDTLQNVDISEIRLKSDKKVCELYIT